MPGNLGFWTSYHQNLIINHRMVTPIIWRNIKTSRAGESIQDGINSRKAERNWKIRDENPAIGWTRFAGSATGSAVLMH